MASVDLELLDGSSTFRDDLWSRQDSSGITSVLENGKVFALIEMQDPKQTKKFGEREELAKVRAEAGVDVASTTVISPIGKHYMPA
jgi:coproporphyrinogen III oxidase